MALEYLTMYSTWIIYVLFGISVGVLSNILFKGKVKYNKYILLVDSIVGIVGAFIFGIVEGFARDRIEPSNYIVALIGAVVAVGVSHLVRRSLEKNRPQDASDGELKKNSIFNKAMLYAVLAWTVNSFIIGIMITLKQYSQATEGIDSFFIKETLRISVTNLFMELVFWLPIIIVSAGIGRKRGTRHALNFIVVAFVIILILWGGWWWFAAL